MPCFYETYFQFRLVILYFVNNNPSQETIIPRLFWLPADLSFMELTPLLVFFFNKCVRLNRTDSLSIVDKKIFGHDGDYDLDDYMSSFLSDNLDEDNIIKIVFYLE